MGFLERIEEYGAKRLLFKGLLIALAILVAFLAGQLKGVTYSYNASNGTLVISNLSCNDTVIETSSNSTVSGICLNQQIPLNYSGVYSVNNVTVTAPAFPQIGKSIVFKWADFAQPEILNYTDTTFNLYIYASSLKFNRNVSLGCGQSFAHLGSELNVTDACTPSIPIANCVNTTVYVNQTVNNTISILKQFNTAIALDCGQVLNYTDVNLTVSVSNYSCGNTTAGGNVSTCQNRVLTPSGQYLCFDNASIWDVCTPTELRQGDWLGCTKRYTLGCQLNASTTGAQLAQCTDQLGHVNDKLTNYSVIDKTREGDVKLVLGIIIVFSAAYTLWRRSQVSAKIPTSQRLPYEIRKEGDSNA